MDWKAARISFAFLFGILSVVSSSLTMGAWVGELTTFYAGIFAGSLVFCVGGALFLGLYCSLLDRED
jgi:hypothetical protein